MTHKFVNVKNLALIISIFIYIFIFFIRSQQGGWEPKLDLFPNLRQNLDQQISQLLPSPQSQLLSGILLGNKKDLPVVERASQITADKTGSRSKPASSL